MTIIVSSAVQFLDGTTKRAAVVSAVNSATNLDLEVAFPADTSQDPPYLTTWQSMKSVTKGTMSGHWQDPV